MITLCGYCLKKIDIKPCRIAKTRTRNFCSRKCRTEYFKAPIDEQKIKERVVTGSKFQDWYMMKTYGEYGDAGKVLAELEREIRRMVPEEFYRIRMRRERKY